MHQRSNGQHFTQQARSGWAVRIGALFGALALSAVFWFGLIRIITEVLS